MAINDSEEITCPTMIRFIGAQRMLSTWSTKLLTLTLNLAEEAIVPCLPWVLSRSSADRAREKTIQGPATSLTESCALRDEE